VLPVLGALLALLIPPVLHAQQFLTDDAAMAAFPACQVEAWRGETETRIEPACRLVRGLEVTLGLGFNPDRLERMEEFALELKTHLVPPRPGGVGLALVGGLDFDARPDDDQAEFAGVFAYLPLTLSLGDDLVLLHANVGWAYGRDADESAEAREHSALLGLRGDLHLPWLEERFVLVGELFGEGRERPEFQVGLRTWVVPDRLVVDVSWGGHPERGARGRGWVFGFGWTPPPLI
jgi:hypothetical protein